MERSGRRLVAGATSALLATAFLLSGPPAASAAPLPPDAGPGAASAAGAYYPAPAQRLLGTAATGYAAVPGADVRVAVAGRPGLPPSGLSAAVVNVTAAAGPVAVAVSAVPASGPLRGGATVDAPLGPDGTDVVPPLDRSTPATTSVTAPAGGTRTGLVTVPLDPAGGFDVRTTGGAARVTVDLVGVYAADDTVVARLGAPGGYQPLDPVRLLGPDDVVITAATAAAAAAATGLPSSAPTIDPTLAAPVPAGATVRLGVDLGPSTSHVTALAIRAGVPLSSVGGTVDVTGGARPVSPTIDTPDGPTPDAVPTGPDVTPTLTLSPGAAASNLAFVPAVLGPDGLLTLEVTNASARPADVRIDLIGFYDDGQLGPNLRFRALTPTRVVDTASGVGVLGLAVGGQGTLSPPTAVAGDNTFALVGTATVHTSGLGADLDLWASSGPRPDAGSVPVSAGSVQTAPVQPELGTDGRLELSSDTGPADLTLDVVGSFEAYPAVTDPTTRGWVHAVPSWQVSAVRR